MSRDQDANILWSGRQQKSAKISGKNNQSNPLADLTKCRDAHPRASKFFQFHAVFLGEIWQNRVWRVDAHISGNSWIRHYNQQGDS